MGLCRLGTCREIANHVGVLLELGIEVLDSEFVVVLDIDVHHLVLLQQLLLAGEDVLQEVLGDDALVWQVEL